MPACAVHTNTIKFINYCHIGREISFRLIQQYDGKYILQLWIVCFVHLTIIIIEMNAEQQQQQMILSNVTGVMRDNN